MAFVLGIDVSTTATKAVLIDEAEMPRAKPATFLTPTLLKKGTLWT